MSLLQKRETEGRQATFLSSILRWRSHFFGTPFNSNTFSKCSSKPDKFTFLLVQTDFDIKFMQLTQLEGVSYNPGASS